VLAAATISGDRSRTPSTSPMSAAAMRASDRAVAMPYAAGTWVP
jgi:hypothetical protein